MRDTHPIAKGSGITPLDDLEGEEAGGGGVHRVRACMCIMSYRHTKRFRTAPIITVIIQVTTLKTTHLWNHAQSIQNSQIQTSDACHGSQGPKFCPL